VAAAEVLQFPVESVYLPVNEVMTRSVRLNRTITTSVASSSTSAADVSPGLIMWFKTQHPDNGTWVPNHCVPLVHQSSFHDTITSAGENGHNDDLSFTRQHCPPTPTVYISNYHLTLIIFTILRLLYHKRSTSMQKVKLKISSSSA